MPYDVSMCTGGDCPLRTNCLRFTGMILARQDFFGSPPYNKTDGTCQHYWDDRPSTAQIQQYAYFIWLAAGKPNGCDIEHWHRAEIELLEKRRNTA